jgi:hypothetical protein
MTIQQFGDATHYVQCTMLEIHGIYLLTKRTGDISASLYQLDNFYVEMSKSGLPNSKPLFKTYSIKEKEIDDYLCQVDLSPIHRLLE